MMVKNRLKKNDGYSMIEISLAMGIFAIGLLAIASMQISSRMGGRSAADSTEAAVVAMDKLEQLMALDYDDESGNNLNDNTGDGESGLSNSTVGTADYNETDSSGKYTILWNVAVNVPISGAKTIRVIVQWSKMAKATGTQGQPGTIFIDSIKAQNI